MKTAEQWFWGDDAKQPERWNWSRPSITNGLADEIVNAYGCGCCGDVDEQDFLAAIAAIQADARAEGRREGLLEALRIMDDIDGPHWPSSATLIEEWRAAIRKLIEAEKGGGG